MKDALNSIADHRGESESLIVREAFALYLREKSEVNPPSNHPSPLARPINYRQTKKGPKARLRVSEGA